LLTLHYIIYSIIQLSESENRIKKSIHSIVLALNSYQYVYKRFYTLFVMTSSRYHGKHCLLNMIFLTSTMGGYLHTKILSI